MCDGNKQQAACSLHSPSPSKQASWRITVAMQCLGSLPSPLPHAPGLIWTKTSPPQAAVHGVAESRARLHFHFDFSLCALEKEMATHSSVLAWRIPGMGGAWWAAVYGVAQSRTRLTRLSSITKISSWTLQEKAFIKFCS